MLEKKTVLSGRTTLWSKEFSARYSGGVVAAIALVVISSACEKKNSGQDVVPPPPPATAPPVAGPVSPPSGGYPQNPLTPADPRFDGNGSNRSGNLVTCTQSKSRVHAMTPIDFRFGKNLWQTIGLTPGFSSQLNFGRFSKAKKTVLNFDWINPSQSPILSAILKLPATDPSVPNRVLFTVAFPRAVTLLHFDGVDEQVAVQCDLARPLPAQAVLGKTLACDGILTNESGEVTVLTKSYPWDGKSNVNDVLYWDGRSNVSSSRDPELEPREIIRLAAYPNAMGAGQSAIGQSLQIQLEDPKLKVSTSVTGELSELPAKLALIQTGSEKSVDRSMAPLPGFAIELSCRIAP